MTRSAVVALSGLLALACATPPAAPREAATPAGPSALTRSLEALGEEAMERGDAALARERFERALAAHPDSIPARAGLARLAAEGGDVPRAASLLAPLAEAPSDDPGLAEARAALARARGDAQAERAHLVRALELAPQRLGAHARLFALTGLAPRKAPADLAAARELARRHPYDPWARLVTARALRQQGHTSAAIAQLQGALFAADLDYAAASAAFRDLQALDPEWRPRRAIPVHTWCDAGLREDPAWQMQVRLLWNAASRDIAALNGVIFLPAGMAGFDSGDEPFLSAIHPRLLSAARDGPSHGIRAGFTAHPVPRTRGQWRRGQAEFLGRHTLVRVQPKLIRSRVLLHELLHLFGGIHVTDALDSIMNPAGEGQAIDALNLRIVRTLRGRRFGPGGLPANVLASVDPRKTVEAYTHALKVNLVFRRMGIAEAIETGKLSRYRAAAQAREARQLDPHLGDVSTFVALLLLELDRVGDAISMLDAATNLYGPKSAKGREARSRADALLRLGRDALR